MVSLTVSSGTETSLAPDVTSSLKVANGQDVAVATCLGNKVLLGMTSQ